MDEYQHLMFFEAKDLQRKHTKKDEILGEVIVEW